MYMISVFALLASSAATQSTVVVLNYIWSDKTLTLQSSDATATTYTNACPTGGGLSTGDPLMTIVGTSASFPTAEPSLPSQDETTQIIPSDINLTPISAPPSSPTGNARRHRMRRQGENDKEDETFCEPYTLIQGASTWEFHMTDPIPGAWTVDSNCSWSGQLTTADITCTATQGGTALGNTGVSTTVFPHSSLTDMEALVTATVVAASSGNISTPTGTPSGSATGGPSASGTGPQSTGLAPAGPLPTGAMLVVGGAAGLFAAALAL